MATLVQAVPRDGTVLLGRVAGNGSVAVSTRSSAKDRGTARKLTGVCSVTVSSPEPQEGEAAVSVSERLEHIMETDPSPLTASRAIDLITELMAVVPHSRREDIDRLKVLDKFLNTARALMETRLKTEDAQAISDRIDAIERELES